MVSHPGRFVKTIYLENRIYNVNNNKYDKPSEAYESYKIEHA